MRFPTLDETIACNEAAREPHEASPSGDDDDLEQVARALERAHVESDPIEAAAALAFQITRAQAFYEANKRTAALIARWFIRVNTDIDPDRVVRPDDHEFGDLLIAAAQGAPVEGEIRGLLNRRAADTGRADT